MQHHQERNIHVVSHTYIAASKSNCDFQWVEVFSANGAHTFLHHSNGTRFYSYYGHSGPDTRLRLMFLLYNAAGVL